MSSGCCGDRRGTPGDDRKKDTGRAGGPAGSCGDSGDVRRSVGRHYADAARRMARTGAGAAEAGVESPGAGFYGEDDANALPADLVRASLGCGNPTAVADLRPGETVLDLGSGAGVDVLLAAKRVAPGRAIGLDMTDEMLALAEENRRKAGVDNAIFLRGTLEAIPLPSAVVDVVISNCVINLAADKGEVLREARRVLRTGGRLAVADIVVDGAIPETVRRQAELWAGCLSGALSEEDYRRKLEAAGFRKIDITTLKAYTRSDLPEDITADAGALAALDGRVRSVLVRAQAH